MIINNKYKVWNELGIDSRSIISNFKKKKVKSRSLASSMSEEFYTFLKDKIVLEETSSKEKYCKKLLETNSDLCLDIYLLSWIKNYFDESLLDDFYLEKYQEDNENNLLALYKICVEDGDEDLSLLKKIHYSTFLLRKKKSFVKCTLNRQIDNLELDINDLNQIERFIRVTYKGVDARKKINVWYSLPVENGFAIFIYKKAKSKAKLAKTNSKSYAFFEYSKPTILVFKDDYQILNVSSSMRKEALKMASSLIHCSLGLGENEILSYEVDNNYSTSTNLGNLINAIVNQETRDNNLFLHEIKINLEPIYDNYLIIQRHQYQSQILPLVTSLSESYELELNSENIKGLAFIYNGDRYGLFWKRVDQQNYAVYLNSYNTKITDVINLITYIEETYEVHLLNK